MGQLVFQATLGGAVNLIGPNTASTVNFTLPSADGSSGQALSTNGSGTLAFGTLAVGAGGTGQTSYTDGQLLIGNSTGNTLTKATLTAGSNITITNAAGAITIAATGGGSAATPTALGTVYASMSTSGAAPYLTAVGYLAGNSNQSGGIANSAFGWGALNANTSGIDNVSLGMQSMNVSTTGSNNTAVGKQALQANTTASYSTAVGYRALYSSNRTADAFASNTAVGYQAGNSVTTGQGNVYIGASAATSSTTSANCIFLGPDAGNFTTPTTAGFCSIFIGVNSCGASSNPTTEIVIGAKNTVGKGNSTGFINPDGGGVYQGNNSSTWSTTSDRRLKKNIVDNTVGLDAITSIQVRNFEYRLPEEITELPTHSAIDKAGVQLGVIAQELQAVLPDCVKQESTGVMSVDPDNLIWYAINAIKELKAENDSLKARLDAANL